jgi:hypothetical protein
MSLRDVLNEGVHGFGTLRPEDRTRERERESTKSRDRSASCTDVTWGLGNAHRSRCSGGKIKLTFDFQFRETLEDRKGKVLDK